MRQKIIVYKKKVVLQSVLSEYQDQVAKDVEKVEFGSRYNQSSIDKELDSLRISKDTSNSCKHQNVSELHHIVLFVIDVYKRWIFFD